MSKKASKRALSLLISAMAILLAAMIAAGILLPMFQITIDKQLLGNEIDVSAYDSAAASAVAQEVEGEGIVLLRNNGVLPLTADKVTLWGLGAAHTAFTGYGSGAGDATNAVRLKAALESVGISVCQELDEFYESKGTTGNTGSFDSVGADTASAEVNPDTIDSSVKEAARSFSDTAIYVLSRVGAENGVMTQKDLALSEYEERTLDYVVENFEHVIVLLNTANQFELGFLDGVGVSRNSGESFAKYAGKIDGVLWVGAPGEVGTYSIARALTGEINPSGRLADTYAYSIESSPAAQNYFSQQFTDAPSISYANYIENIYVGYKWYETAAHDGAIDYDDSTGTPSRYTDGTVPMGVQFPFGYGGSYTSFSWELEGVSGRTSFNGGDKESSVTVKIKVTNTGSAAGKDVVELYVTPPYTDGGIEKAYLELIGFAKTSLLEPGRSETVSITFDLYDLASYDYSDANGNGIRGYELERGAYIVRALKNAHDWVNVGENSELAVTLTVNEDIYYQYSLVTGAEVVNQFQDLDGGIEFLSRAGGFRNAAVVRQTDHATTDYRDHNGDTGMVMRVNAMADGAPDGEVNDYEKGVDYEVDLGEDAIMFDAMISVPYDDGRWDTFVSQMSKSELAELIAYGGYSTIGVERLGIPATVMLDGPSAVKSTFSTGEGTLLQPCEVVVSSTWNQELAHRQGIGFGSDAANTGVAGWYAPSVNIHRTPYNGRNYEYYSEDAVLSGIMAREVTLGAQACGINVTLKHLLLYCDAATTGWKWCTEQAVREIYLRPFQIGIEEGGARQLMTSNSFNGIWVGCSEELLTNVIRGEFGFEGLVVSDAATQLFWVQKGIRAGNDLWLSFDNSRRITLVKEKNVAAMQQAARHILYAVSRSSVAMNTTVETASWSPAMVGLGIIEAVGAVGIAVCAFFTVRQFRRGRQNGYRDEGGMNMVLAILGGAAQIVFVVSALFFALSNYSHNLFDAYNRAVSGAALAGLIGSAAVWLAAMIFGGKEKKKG